MKENGQITSINDDVLDQVSGGTGSETTQKEWWTCADCGCGRYFVRNESDGKLHCESCGGTRNVMSVVLEIDPSSQHAE